MKLSEKGYLKIGNSIVGWFENGVAKVTFDPDKIEFEPDDFEGSVVLTIDEAYGAFESVREGIMMCESAGRYSHGLVFLKAFLAKRIKQAEGKK